MAPPLLLLLPFLLSLLSSPAIAKTEIQSDGPQGFISAIISEKGLVFVKDLLIQQALSSLTPLHLPKIQKSIKIPFLGGVHVSLSNITLSQINVSSSVIKPGDTGVVIVASGATANMSMDWRYSYSTWLIPVHISDKGRAFIQVEGMEVGITIKMKNQEGSLKLNLSECGCYLKDISITLDGGASWFYQGLVDAFEGQIISAVENAITKKIKEGIVRLDTFLQELPKEVPVDDIAALNVTFMNDPLLRNSSVGFEINGLFTTVPKVATLNYHLTNSQHSAFCKAPLKMLWISLDEAVLNSASDTYFQAGIMTWTVDKVPEQSLLNTAGWKYIVPQLYKKYPNDDMQLNITSTSPPRILVAPDKIGASVTLDMVIEVLDANEIIPVACLSMDISASGFVEISGNNLAGEAGLDDFTLTLKWSKVGNFHMYLVQTVVRVFLKDVALPYVNSHLKKGFPLPIIRGFTLTDAGLTSSIILRSGRLSDVISELQELIKGVNEVEVSSSNHFDSALLAAQIRQLAQEVRDLTLSRPVTIWNENSSANGGLAPYLMPAAAVGAMGYCYMWWKGWSFSDVMFVTKRNMANAVSNVSKQLEQVSTALASTKRHLSQGLEILDWKMDEQKETSKLIMNEVDEVKSDLSQIGFDIGVIQNMIAGLEDKIGLLEDKQDFANTGVWYLCQIAGGIKDGLSTKLFQDFSAKLPLEQPKPTFSEENSLKGLQFIAETIKSGEIQKPVNSTILQNDLDDKPAKTTPPLKARIYRSFPKGISLAPEGCTFR